MKQSYFNFWHEKLLKCYLFMNTWYYMAQNCYFGLLIPIHYECIFCICALIFLICNIHTWQKYLGIVMFTLGYNLLHFSLLLPYTIPKIWIQHSQYVFCHLHVYDFRADQVVLRNLWPKRLFECFQRSSFLHSYEIFFLGVC